MGGLTMISYLPRDETFDKIWLDWKQQKEMDQLIFTQLWLYPKQKCKNTSRLPKWQFAVPGQRILIL